MSTCYYCGLAATPASTRRPSTTTTTSKLHLSSILFHCIIAASIVLLAPKYPTSTHTSGRPQVAAAVDEPFRFRLAAAAAASSSSSSVSPGAELFSSDSSNSNSNSPSSPANNPLVWQPLPLRATFRPLNRGGGSGASTAAGPPQPPAPPTPPLPPSAPELPFGESPSGFSELATFPLPSRRSSSASASFASNSNFISPSITSQPPSNNNPPSPPTATTPRPAATPSTTSVINNNNNNGGDNDNDDQLPTRQPLARFRPTRAPSDDEDFGVFPPGGASSTAPGGGNSSLSVINNIGGGGGAAATAAASSALLQDSAGRQARVLSQECYECICEASTSCNGQSRCQTSDVRHTRCGMFLISYDQWLASGLSRELVSAEALARDEAADERAFYECVTRRECAERLLANYLDRNNKDCDKDGRIDCYDFAAIHHSGLEQCASEQLLDSQYWSDFNACFGFGRRRR